MYVISPIRKGTVPVVCLTKQRVLSLYMVDTSNISEEILVPLQLVLHESEPVVC